MTSFSASMPPTAPETTAAPGAQDMPAATVYRPNWRALIYGMGFTLWLVGVVLVWWAYEVHLGVAMGVTFLPLGAAALDSARLDKEAEDPEAPYEAHASATHVVCQRCTDWIPRHKAVVKDGVFCSLCAAELEVEVA